MIGLALDSGSSKAGHVFSPLQIELNGLLAEACPGNFSNSIVDCVLALRVSGEIANFGFEGCDKIKLQKSSSRLTVDIGIPEARWNGKKETEIRQYLAQHTRDAVNKVVIYLKQKGQIEPSIEVLRHVFSVIDNFENAGTSDR